MKIKKVITLLVLVLSIGQTNAQTYVPFPDSNICWKEISYYQGACEPPNYCRHLFYLMGDTMLNTKTYHKIYGKNYISNDSYVGAIRENNKRVYYFDFGCTHEILLYDFHLNIGDSFNLPVQLCDTSFPMYIKVVSIDSVLLTDLTYRRKINFNWGSEYSWIEGMGGVSGLLYPAFAGISCICWIELVCFQQDSTTLYLNENHMLCSDFSSSNMDLMNYSGPFHVYPVPANKKSVISFESETELIKGIEIYDILGKQIKSIQNLSEKKIQMQNESLTPGIYIFKAMLSGEKNIYGKIIIE